MALTHLSAHMLKCNVFSHFSHAIREDVMMLDGLQPEQPASNGDAAHAQSSSPGKSSIEIDHIMYTVLIFACHLL